jgi:hypothetical protein
MRQIQQRSSSILLSGSPNLISELQKGLMSLPAFQQLAEIAISDHGFKDGRQVGIAFAKEFGQFFCISRDRATASEEQPDAADQSGRQQAGYSELGPNRAGSYCPVHNLGS